MNTHQKHIDALKSRRNKPIYVITVTADDICHSRTIGFYHDMDEALRISIYDTDIFENGYYTYLCIECIKEGCHYLGLDNQLWLNNNGEEINTPDKYKNTIGIGMG